MSSGSSFFLSSPSLPSFFCRAEAKASRSPSFAAATASSPRSNSRMSGASWPDWKAEEKRDSACWN